MNINIVKVLNPGDSQQERVHLKASQDTDLGRFLVFNTRQISPGKISSNLETVYWFPDQSLKVGDVVVLYTKSGADSQKTNADGTTTYFYYWGLSSPLWASRPDHGPMVLELATWEFKKSISE